MSDSPVVPKAAATAVAEQQENTEAEYLPAKALEKLPPETRDVVSVIAGFFRSTTGPDPETAKIVAESEMHEETCKLEGYKETLKLRDKQSERDHEFRKKKLNHETGKALIVILVAVSGIIAGLYLLVSKNNSAVGTPLLVAGFMALIGEKSVFSKNKD
ncbi:MAG: hypothetical protein ACP5E2_08470 [Terracidiphilus sp.]